MINFDLTIRTRITDIIIVIITFATAVLGAIVITITLGYWSGLGYLSRFASSRDIVVFQNKVRSAETFGKRFAYLIHKCRQGHLVSFPVTIQILVESRRRA